MDSSYCWPNTKSNLYLIWGFLCSLACTSFSIWWGCIVKKRQVITFGSCASMLRNGWRSRFALLLHSSEPALGFKIRGSGEKEVDFYLSQYIHIMLTIFPHIGPRVILLISGPFIQRSEYMMIQDFFFRILISRWSEVYSFWDIWGPKF